jgi:hypothetical protein
VAACPGVSPDHSSPSPEGGRIVLAFLLEMYWGLAVFFTVMFLWQLAGTLLGHFGGDHDLATGHVDTEMSAGGAGHHDVGAAQHGSDVTVSFKLVSIRSVSAFGLLFGWAGVLYARDADVGSDRVILYSFGWGLAGMLAVSAIFYLFQRMTETGTRRLISAVGQRGTVYMDIPAGGTGQVKTVVSGTVSFVSARAVGGEALKAGTPVVVKRLLDAYTIEVDKVEDKQ